MVDVVFKNVEKSDFAKLAAQEKIEDLTERFPDLEHSHIVMTLSMENSPTQSGPDVFTAKFLAKSGKFRGLILQKSADTLYSALGYLADRLSETLNRSVGKSRLRKVKQARAAKWRLVHT